MQPEIHAKRAIGEVTNAPDLLAQIVRREVQPREDSERSRARHFSGQLRPRDAPHARLNDRIADVEEAGER